MHSCVQRFWAIRCYISSRLELHKLLLSPWPNPTKVLEGSAVASLREGVGICNHLIKCALGKDASRIPNTIPWLHEGSRMCCPFQHQATNQCPRKDLQKGKLLSWDVLPQCRHQTPKSASHRTWSEAWWSSSRSQVDTSWATTVTRDNRPSGATCFLGVNDWTICQKLFGFRMVQFIMLLDK